ncbi:hypothetical protein, partial [Parvibaculum sp.]|uniref:hypothetical protein n=1 Tax=Parvibaculum sp. TaxID=2024848 RepID=UPI003C740BD4
MGDSLAVETGSRAAASGRAFLGVERSATGRAWVSRLADDRLALAIAQREGLPEIVARVLAGRGGQRWPAVAGDPGRDQRGGGLFLLPARGQG